MFGARQRKATGIHLADRALQIVELTRQRGEVSLTALVQETLPFACTPARLAGSENRELARFLRQVGRERGLAFANPGMALGPHGYLLVRRPWIRGGEQVNRQHLLWEVQQVLPDRLSAYRLDMARTPQGCFLVAARKKALRLYAALCRQAGVKDPLFDVGPFALYNALEASGCLAGEEAEVLVELGGAEALVLLLNAGELQAVGFCAWEGETPQARREALAERVQQLVESESPRRPGRLRLCGPVAGEPEYSALLSARTGLPADLFDPFAGVDLSALEEEASPAARAACAVAAGLAYRCLSEDD